MNCQGQKRSNLNDRGQTFFSLSVLIALVLCGGYYLLMPEWRLSQLLLDIEEGLLPKTCTKPSLLKFNLNASSLERNENKGCQKNFL